MKRSLNPEIVHAVVSQLSTLVDVALGHAPADLLLVNGQVVNVFSGEILSTNVAIVQGRIAGVGPGYCSGKEVIDLKGRFLLPGLMDGHIHLESTMLTPAEFSRAVLPHGTTCIFIDPHEIANILGFDGIRYLIESSRNLPLDIYLTAPSCVPATNLETSGSSLASQEIEEVLQWQAVLGLAEMMNVPGVLSRDPEVLRKLAVAHLLGKCIDGHAPGVSGPPLTAYIATGIESDHESCTIQEAVEKLRLGMWVMIREGSAARNLQDLVPMVNESNWHRIMLVSDDREARDLITEGHMDHALRKAVALGVPPVRAVQMATLNPAVRFGLRDRGGVAPWYLADLVIMEDLRQFQTWMVIKEGKVVYRDGEVTAPLPAHEDPSLSNSINIQPVTPEQFSLYVKEERGRVIGLLPDQIVTRTLIQRLSKNGDGEVLSCPDRDLVKIAVVERHRASGEVAVGLLSGLGLRKGALASSLAHDSHNIIVVGASSEEMARAVQVLQEIRGGLVVIENGSVRSALPLPVAGVISPLSAAQVAGKTAELLQAARGLGVTLNHPFLTISFLTLPVIPSLKITNKGLIDVEKFQIVPVGIEEGC